MNCARLIQFLFTTTCLLSSALFSATSNGLWHAVRGDTSGTVFYAVVDGKNARFYDAFWKLLEPKEFSVDSNLFKLVLPFKSTGLFFDGKFENETLSGDWQMPHIQFPYTGKWSAKRVSSDPKWTPNGFLSKSDSERVSSVLDGLELSKGLSSFEEFKTRWKSNVEPEFYALLTQSVYAQPKEREKKLEEIYSLVHSKPGDYEQIISDLTGLTTSVLEKLQQKFPELTTRIPIVYTLALGNYDYRLQMLSFGGDEEWLLRLGVDWMAENLKSADEREAMIAEAIAYSAYCMKVPLPERIPAEFLRRGIAARLSSEALGIERVGRAEAEAAAKLKAELNRNLMASSGDFFPSFLKPNQRPVTYSVALDFVESLLENSKSGDLLKMPSEKIGKALNAYLQADRGGQ